MVRILENTRAVKQMYLAVSNQQRFHFVALGDPAEICLSGYQCRCALCQKVRAAVRKRDLLSSLQCMTVEKIVCIFACGVLRSVVAVFIERIRCVDWVPDC